MYTAEVVSQNAALAHLLFHCCLKDGRFSDAEIDKVSELFVQCGIDHDLNFKDEVLSYRGYIADVPDEQAYLDYLVKTIMPVNELAVFSWCVELALADGILSDTETLLLDKIATALEITADEQEIITRLLVQRKVVMTEKIC